MMAGFHLDGLAAQGQTHDLVAQANAEQRYFAGKRRVAGIDGVIARFGIARPIGQEDAIGIQGQHFLAGVCAGHQGNAAAAVGKQAQDIGLDRR